jgi:DNA-binding LacI/PurR family transcriptional regulator
MFTSDATSSASLHREGLQEALRKQGLELPNEMVCYCPGAVPLVMPTLEESVAREVARLWSRPEADRPTAVYVTTSVIAEVLYMKLLEQGLRSGRDVSLLAFGASQRSGAVNSKLSSIVVDELQIGRYAVELLDQARRADRFAGAESNRLIRHAELSLAPGETLMRLL